MEQTDGRTDRETVEIINLIFAYPNFVFTLVRDKYL
jgi:hypothetical protein